MKKEESYIYYDEEEELHVGVYELEGEICPYFVLKDAMFKQTAGYCSMKADLLDCLEAIKYIEKIKDSDDVPQIIKTSLLFAGIMKYAKCFTSGKGRGVSLNEKDVFKGNADLLQFHEETMEIRHRYLAHAGNTVHESRALIAILGPYESNKKIEDIKFASFRLKDDDSNLQNYGRLFEWVMNKIDSKLEKLKATVRDHAGKIPIEKMYLEAKKPDPKNFIPFDVNLL